MRTGADQQFDNLKELNQYLSDNIKTMQTTEVCSACESNNAKLFISDGKAVCEHYLQQQAAANSSFLKINNDPRVTRIGTFIRNTSIDEIPQLWNVLKGDMSLVGNRPLPLYEAERLTKDQVIKRFEAAAGITGLWQVTKRGKAEMSEKERMDLDVEYSKRQSFWFDIELLFRTVPALFQKEAV